ncbi:hypothetical protein K2173_002888 [Erythroxylum novogranatense]|uniref:Hyaluronan/mRNA-binding protein domain-containing protein n=1 Tax=Erythroxylum novogranatense TaxID=1862640 RepID=A0AAV8SQ78_9ROSI|nr:hypothetical protein K2173_002888 [Erythroxylum novogranatense]
MATMNPFGLLGDDDNEDPSQLIVAAAAVAAQLKAEKPKKAPVGSALPQAQATKPAKLPSKPLPPTQAVMESKNEGGRGGGRAGGRSNGRGRGRSSGGFNGDSNNNETTFGSNNGFLGGYRASEEGDAGKPSERRSYGAPRGGGGGFRGARRGVLSNGDTGDTERPRRLYERHSGTGRGNEFKRDGAGRGNWGIPTDEIAPETEEAVVENEKSINTEPSREEDVGDANKDNADEKAEEKEPENKEMTLEEYEKVREEKRKALLALKPEERKVNVDKDFQSMQQLSNKRENDEIFIKLGSEKDKQKDANDKEVRAKKAVSINEFLKPAEGESYHSGGGRGRGRGRVSRGGFGRGSARDVTAPSIEDPGHFPSLGGK